MPKCIKCGCGFKLPKDRSFGLLCEECKAEHLYQEPLVVKIENYLGRAGEDDEV